MAPRCTVGRIRGADGRRVQHDGGGQARFVTPRVGHVVPVSPDRGPRSRRRIVAWAVAAALLFLGRSDLAQAVTAQVSRLGPSIWVCLIGIATLLPHGWDRQPHIVMMSLASFAAAIVLYKTHTGSLGLDIYFAGLGCILAMAGARRFVLFLRWAPQPMRADG